MRLLGLIFSTLLLVVNGVQLDERQDTLASTKTATLSGSLAPAQTTDFRTSQTPSSDPDLDNSAGDNENGPPDAEDIAWVSAFMDGEPVDETLDFDAHDLIEEDDNGESDASDNLPGSAINNTFITSLTKRRSRLAFARAHYRARQRNAGLSSAGSPAAEDHDWAIAFFNGEEVDADLIWDSADLDAPAEDSSNDAQLLAAADFNDWTLESAARASATNTTALSSALAKRTHHHHSHKPHNALQVIRRSQRAARRARHRARVRQHKRAIRRHRHAERKRKRIAHQRHVMMHHAAGGLRYHAKHDPKIPQYPDAKHRADGTLRHGVKQCGHHTPIGTNCDGSIDCHWWCVRGIQNCGFDSAC